MVCIQIKSDMYTIIYINNYVGVLYNNYVIFEYVNKYIYLVTYI